MNMKQPRVNDPDAMFLFRLEMMGEPCEVCELRPGSEVRHRVFRSQGGGDVPENFVWACTVCHRDLHEGRA